MSAAAAAMSPALPAGLRRFQVGEWMALTVASFKVRFIRSA